MDETKLRSILGALYESGVLEGAPSPGNGVTDELGSVDAAAKEILALLPPKVHISNLEDLADDLTSNMG